MQMTTARRELHLSVMFKGIPEYSYREALSSQDVIVKLQTGSQAIRQQSWLLFSLGVGIACTQMFLLEELASSSQLLLEL